MEMRCLIASALRRGPSWALKLKASKAVVGFWDEGWGFGLEGPGALGQVVGDKSDLSLSRQDLFRS